MEMEGETSGPSVRVESPESEEVKDEKKNENNEENEEEEEGERRRRSGEAFECNICLDVAKDAVVSYCGHLFCWPCLHQWLETRPTRPSCPVCKALISKDKVIPLYGRGGSNVDPRSKVPPRPTPTRSEEGGDGGSGRFTWGGGVLGDGGPAGSFHMSFGIGAFPFGFFTSALNWGQTPTQATLHPEQMEEQEFLSKVFLYIALIFIAWLLIA